MKEDWGLATAARIIQILQIRLHRHLLDPSQDWRLGIDASARHWPSELSLQGPNAEQAAEYIGTPTWVLSRALDRLGIDPRNFVFIDLGSGKGQVILRAAARPFRRVEGVEFSEPLHRLAIGNIASAKAAGHLRAPVVSRNLDATKYDLPREKVMQQFAERLLASLRAQPRSAIFIYLNPQHPECLGDAFEPLPPSPRQAALDRLISPWPLAIYRYREAVGAAVAA